MQRLDGQVALVTGSASGIGLGIARVLAEEGAAVVIADMNIEKAEAVAGELCSTGADALAVEVDVTSASSIGTAVDRVADAIGEPEILAANAGIYPLAAVADITEAEWDRVMDLNAKGALYCVQACLPRMRRRGYGRIVLTSSITGPITGHPGFAHYGASKAAMLGMMRSVAIETARQGITINAVMPGNVATPGVEAVGDEHSRQMMSAIPMGRFAQPEDIGWAVRVLAAAECGYITGQTLIVDGGQVLPEAPDALA